MHAFRACLLALGLSLLLGCGSSYNSSLMNSSGSAGGGPGSIPSQSLNGPTIDTFSPHSTPAGSPDIQLEIQGTKFPPNPSTDKDHAGVYWTTDGGRTGSYLEMKEADETHLTAVIPAKLLVNPGKAIMQVQIYHFADDTPKATSNTVTFTVTN